MPLRIANIPLMGLINQGISCLIIIGTPDNPQKNGAENNKTEFAIDLLLICGPIIDNIPSGTNPNTKRNTIICMVLNLLRHFSKLIVSFSFSHLGATSSPPSILPECDLSIDFSHLFDSNNSTTVLNHKPAFPHATSV